MGNTPLDHVFRANLRALRKAKGLTQVQAARLLKMTQGAYSQLEAGESSPSLATVHKVARAFRVEAFELLAALEAVP